jgi:hypothetical protein
MRDDDRKTVFLTYVYSYIFSVFALQICSWAVAPLGRQPKQACEYFSARGGRAKNIMPCNAMSHQATPLGVLGLFIL